MAVMWVSEDYRTMSNGRSLFRALGTAAAASRIAGRQVFRLDTNPVPGDWTHVTKVDPEPGKLLPLLYPLYLQHTDAVSVGGSRSVDDRTTEETFDLLEWAAVPAFHEPSSADHVTEKTLEKATFLAIPEVLNGDSTALVGTLGEGLDHIRNSLAPSELAERLPAPTPNIVRDRLADFLTSWLVHEAVFEAYIIQNPDSAAAREANVSEADVLSVEDARKRAMAAERHLGSELVYLEYSGTFGGAEAVETIRAIDRSTSWSRIWYGGGLASADDVAAIRAAGADTVVVGDVFHDVASEERSVCERARDDLDDDPDHEAVRAWIDENVDLADAAAVRYLETVPDVEDAPTLAREYLTATVRTWLHLANGETDDPDAERVGSRRVASILAAISPRYLSGPTREDFQRYVRTVATALGDGAIPEGSFPASHLSLADADSSS